METAQKTLGKIRRRCRARTPASCRCPRPQAVRCPLCRRTFVCVVPRPWALRLLRRTLDYPPLACADCQRAADYARAHGGRREEWTNPEKAPC